MIQRILSELQYYNLEMAWGKWNHELEAHIREFQRDIEAKATGVLLYAEFEELAKRFNAVHPEYVGLAPARYPFSFFYMGTYATVEGTWVFCDRTMNTPPIQTSKIRLDRTTMKGTEAIAQIDYSKESPILTVDFVDWTITKWTSEEIVAESEAMLVACTLTVDVKGQKVHQYRRGKGSHSEAGIALEPKVLELVDGFKVAQQFKEERQKEVNNAMASSYRKVQDLMVQKMPPANEKGSSQNQDNKAKSNEPNIASN